MKALRKLGLNLASNNFININSKKNLNSLLGTKAHKQIFTLNKNNSLYLINDQPNHKNLIRNYFFTISSKNFSFKYIPVKKLKFQDIGYSEKVCLIYEQNEIQEKKFKAQRNINYISLASTISLLTYLGFSYISTGISSVFLPLIYLSFIKHKKYLTSFAKKIYLCRNGHQIILLTFDDYFHLVNIKDINKILFFNIKKLKAIPDKFATNSDSNAEQDDTSLANKEQDGYLFETFDKKFIINLNPKHLKSINGEIFDSLNTRSIIATGASYSNYSRLYFPK